MTRGEITRRTALKQGAVLSGGVLVGNAMLSQTAQAVPEQTQGGGTGWVTHGPGDFAAYDDVTAFQISDDLATQPNPNIPLTVTPSCNENQEPVATLKTSYGIKMLEKSGNCYVVKGTERIWPYPESKTLEIGAIYRFNTYKPCATPERPASDRVTFAKMQNASLCTPP